ncbi:MAG TPA: YdiU family protein [Myxococcota bacterium]
MSSLPSFWSPTFSNSFATSLPADPRSDLATRQVRGALWSKTTPTPVSSPTLLAWSKDVAAALGLPADDVAVRQHADRLAAIFAGNEVLPGMLPMSTRYGGHQFGNWAGQLGDGRAIALGEVLTSSTTGAQRFELQLKGAGPTPYSRRADGRAVLRSSLREYVCSEAMHHLGVPTTRALSLVATGDDVVRDMLYDGHPAAEPGAVVCRVAPSFLRFGHFEMLADDGDLALLKQLFSYAVSTHFPGLSADADDPAAVVAFIAEVGRRTASLIVHWQRAGFVHGVMNTDNMSVLGLTIDYGPYGFLEPFDPGWTPNTTDAGRRRYRMGNQPAVAHWNLVCFAEALLPLVKEPAPLAALLDGFVDDIQAQLRTMQLAKIGLAPGDGNADSTNADDDALLAELHALLGGVETDYTIWHRRLADVAAGADEAVLKDAYYDDAGFDAVAAPRAAWLARWRARCGDDVTGDARRARMNATNPLYVPRNWIAQEVIDAATDGNLEPLSSWMAVLRRPYDEQPGQEHFAGKRPEWARHKAGCSMLSCSS